MPVYIWTYILENPCIRRHFGKNPAYIEWFSYVEVFARLGSSHSFLSMIFGILGKFWVDIGKKNLKHIFEKKIRYKKNRDDKKIFPKNLKKYFFEKSTFWKFWKSKLSKNRHFKIFEKKNESSNFQNLQFSKFWFFKFLMFQQKNQKKSSRFFCLEKNMKNILDPYQFKISPGFQKSYLENRASSPNTQKLHENVRDS